MTKKLVFDECSQKFREMVGFVLISLTFEAIDAAQVDVCHVRAAWSVICESELAEATEINSASIGADIANHVDDTACKGACGQV